MQSQGSNSPSAELGLQNHPPMQVSTLTRENAVFLKKTHLAILDTWNAEGKNAIADSFCYVKVANLNDLKQKCLYLISPSPNLLNRSV